LYNVPRFIATIEGVLDCYNVAQEYQEDEDPRNFHIPGIEGECVVEGPELESIIYAKPLRTWKVNIGTEDRPMFSNIGDY